MPTYIKSNDVPEISRFYLTPGKAYECKRFERGTNGKPVGATIVDNEGFDREIFIPMSSHLSGGSWVICDEEGNEV